MDKRNQRIALGTIVSLVCIVALGVGVVLLSVSEEAELETPSIVGHWVNLDKEIHLYFTLDGVCEGNTPTSVFPPFKYSYGEIEEVCSDGKDAFGVEGVEFTHCIRIHDELDSFFLFRFNGSKTMEGLMVDVTSGAAAPTTLVYVDSKTKRKN